MSQALELIEGHVPIEPPDGVEIWDIDPYSTQVLSCMEDYYAELRSKGSFAYIPKYSMLVCGRFAETQEVFSDWERFVSSRGVGLSDFKLCEPWRPPSIILEVDPPSHERTRRVMVRSMSPAVVRDLIEQFRVAADELVDKLLGNGSFDAVPDLAEVYPTTVFPKAVGLRETDARRLIDYGSMVFNALGPDNELRRSSMAKGPDIVPWITRACERDALDEGGIGHLIYEGVESGDVTAAEAGMLVRSLLSAGIDTTVTAIGSMLWCLATNPQAYATLRSEPGLSRHCFNEVLRFTSPVHSFCRTANLDTQVNGIKIVEGTKILCVLGAANLDDRKWPQADKFDVRRKPVGHLAFGTGVHACVGQNVARAEVDALLNALIEKVAHIELVGDAAWRPGNAIHSLESLPIRLHAA
jgi:4-methoxybenzoate monooxygenase (O-demethylating)